LRTIAGYEAMNMIRKGQIRWQAKGDITGQVHYIEQISELLPNRSIPLTPTRLSKPICDRSAIGTFQVRVPLFVSLFPPSHDPALIDRFRFRRLTPGEVWPLNGPPPLLGLAGVGAHGPTPAWPRT